MEYRVEQKYLVSEGQMLFLQKQLEGYMAYDEFHPDGEPYTVRSVYFDDMYDSFLRENEDGTDNREKYRIRIYDGDMSEIHLECKSKLNGYTKKVKENLTREDCLCYINKGLVVLHEDDGFLKKKVYALNRLSGFCPVQIVEYERVAFVEEIGNVRITLDRNICGTNKVERFTQKEIYGVPALPVGMHILEVKYDEMLPDYITTILRSVPLRRTSFSKYYYTRNNEMVNRE